MKKKLQTRDWANTIGKCSCGHSQPEHGSPTKYTDRPNQTRIPGHGGCEVGKCKCPQFTWVGWM